jgi:hypothetical protein
VRKLMAIAAVGCLFGMAQAGVVYFDYSEVPVSCTATHTGYNDFPDVWLTYVINLSIDGAAWIGGISETNTSIIAATYFNKQTGRAMACADFGYRNNWTTYAQTLGDTVGSETGWDPTSATTTNGYLAYGAWVDLQAGEGIDFSEETVLLGFRLDRGDSNYNYGWLTLYSSAYADTAVPGGKSISTVSVLEMAYESQLNTSITVGAIPEPATGSLVALVGLAGVLIRRRFCD